MMNHKNPYLFGIPRRKYGTRLVLCVLAALFVTATADANILRVFQAGDALPTVTLPDLETGKTVTINPVDAKPSALVFFSVTPEFRKKRSLALLSELSDLSGTFKNRVRVVGIYVDDDRKGRTTVIDYAKAKSLKVPLIHDRERSVYEQYGVFMMPLVVLVNTDGNLHEVVPYTYDIKNIIEGNFRLLLGEWSEGQLRDFLKPKENIELSEEEKEYIRRVNYGRVLAQRKMYSQAMREFNTAIKLFPKRIEAQNQLGFVQLARKKWDNAEKIFRQVLKTEPQSDDGIAGLGLALYGRGDGKAALPQLESAFIAPEPRIEVILALADLHEKKGNMRKAIRLNKLVIARLMIKFNQRWK